MGQIIYTLSVKLPSRKAKKMYGYGWTWHVRAKFRMRLPESERDLHRLFLPYVKYDAPCMVRLIRNNAKGEDKGFKAVVYGHMTPRSLEIIRRARAWHKATSLSTHKPIPTIGESAMPWNRQPSWAKPPLDARLQGIPRNRFKHGPFSGRIK
jgi:hypothetical protein